MQNRAILALTFCLIICPSLANAKLDTIRRFALVIGANNGGPEREILKYAISDANSLMIVLNRLGGVMKEDGLSLFEPDRRAFESTVRKLYKNIKIAKSKYKKVELIFYYSGHSDDEGILLGKEKIDYREIREIINKMPADVRIAILDSCSSGEFTRSKGGKRRIPFLMDSSYDMKGYAFMTSSAFDEASQESDKIKGSFFTHYLVSGLRGAADMTQDGRITLNEAYQFAFNETLARTEKTMSGPQHPNYNIQMSGTGDVIITDIRKSSTGLILNRSVYGKFFIRDMDNILIAEFSKSYGRDVEIGIDSGRYRIINTRDGELYEATASISGEKRFVLRSSDFKLEGRESTRNRGDSESSYDNIRTAIKNSIQKALGDDDFVVGNLLKLNHGGYGAPYVKMTRIGPEDSLLVGGRGGWIINDSFAIGGGGCGLVTPHKLEKITGKDDPDKLKFGMGYGGMRFEYYFLPKGLFVISIGTLIGAGGYSLYQQINYDGNSDNGDNTNNSNTKGEGFFVLEPELNMFINITRFFRIGIGGSYRFINGVNEYDLKDRDLRDFSGQIVFAFGWF